MVKNWFFFFFAFCRWRGGGVWQWERRQGSRFPDFFYACLLTTIWCFDSGKVTSLLEMKKNNCDISLKKKRSIKEGLINFQKCFLQLFVCVINLWIRFNNISRRSFLDIFYNVSRVYLYMHVKFHLKAGVMTLNVNSFPFQSLSEVTDTDALFALLSSLKLLILHGESLNYTINQYTDYITYTLRKAFLPKYVI